MWRSAQDLDEAIAIAAQIPSVQVGIIEIRPVIEVAGKSRALMSAKRSSNHDGKEFNIKYHTNLNKQIEMGNLSVSAQK
ncbi:YciI family protein [Nostoc sp. ChiSLP03a]|uniref:YciI family protein n=1 Tax=Nostoc sp. ChiSLP03a TaxID=3075380 RepID=UPI002AD53ACC|nr:YciI family protein [Nostoc sp. ChiSLP03a]MDZ8213560.1 YciI family protein [Nostoc sp. ChiSLP03a]